MRLQEESNGGKCAAVVQCVGWIGEVRTEWGGYKLWQRVNGGADPVSRRE